MAEEENPLKEAYDELMKAEAELRETAARLQRAKTLVPAVDFDKLLVKTLAGGETARRLEKITASCINSMNKVASRVRGKLESIPDPRARSDAKHLFSGCALELMKHIESPSRGSDTGKGVIYTWPPRDCTWLARVVEDATGRRVRVRHARRDRYTSVVSETVKMLKDVYEALEEL